MNKPEGLQITDTKVWTNGVHGTLTYGGNTSNFWVRNNGDVSITEGNDVSDEIKTYLSSKATKFWENQEDAD